MARVHIIRGETLVDAEDEHYILNAMPRWYVDTSNGYASRRIRENGKYKKQYLHRIIMNAPKRKVVDHINHNKLDNRKENMRIVDIKTNSQNTFGRGYTKTPGTKSRFTAGIMVDRKRIHLGQFGSTEEAHAAYLKAKKQFHNV